jgi:tetrahydromethanopterin S-methyltransferase subunit G
MDENDFKRLLNESAAETHRLIDANAAETRERFSKMDARFDQVDARFEQVDARFDQVERRVDANAADTQQRFDRVDARAEELKRHIDATAAQMKMDFGTAVEDMRTDVQRIAESVLMVNAKLDREAADIRAEMRQGFADTQALLRFSHGKLDDRVSALERAAK